MSTISPPWREPSPRRATVLAASFPYPPPRDAQAMRGRRSTFPGRHPTPTAAAAGMDWSAATSASSSPILPALSLHPSSSSMCSSPGPPVYPSTHHLDPPSFHAPPVVGDSYTLSPEPTHYGAYSPRHIPYLPLEPPHSQHTTPPLSSPSASPSAGGSTLDLAQAGRDELEAETRRLRQKVRDLEFINDLVRLRVAELEASPAESDGGIKPDPSGSGSVSPAPLHHLPLPSASSGSPSDWDRRTDARVRRFCSLNRAGNALCAWHDSRRERRAFPPRMAPPNTLNCGCTFAQALFEESLARNGVGAYFPGESVRMDPALRNPLLELLERRYGYRDGDFEREGSGWREGEGASAWERAATAGRAGGLRPSK